MTAASSWAVPSASRRRPGSPWMPIPSSTSPSGRSKIGRPAAGGVHDDSATPNERARSFTRRAMPATAARSSPRSAAAPAIFSSSTVAPTPRRPAV